MIFNKQNIKISAGEELFFLHLKALKLPLPTREFEFSEKRKWRFDFAWTDQLIAVEIEGGTKYKSRHTTFEGFQADCNKYNIATLLGWKIFRFTWQDVKAGRAIKFMERLLKVKTPSRTVATQGKNEIISY